MQSIDRKAARLASCVRELLISLKRDIGDDYRADDESTTPSMCVTISAPADLSDYGWQTGDNSFAGGAYGYPYWGVITLTRRSNCRDLARDAIGQIVDQIDP